MNIAIPFAAVVGAVVPSAGFNNNFTEVANKFNTYAVQTDVAKVITAAHTFSVQQVMNGGLAIAGDVLFTDASFDIGKSGASRPRDGFFSRAVTVGTTLTATTLVGAHAAASLTGTALPAAIVTSSLQTFGVLGGNLLFTDATFDIGASGATRPRDGFFSRNLTAGQTITAGTQFSAPVNGPTSASINIPHSSGPPSITVTNGDMWTQSTGLFVKINGANKTVLFQNTQTGYTAMTGSLDRSTSYATGTITLPQLAGRVMALQADLTTFPIIGP